MKKSVFGVLFAACMVLLLEGLASFIWLQIDYRSFVEQLPVAASFKEEFHAQHDPEIGWVHVPRTQIKDFYGPGKHITINSQGVRALRDYGETNNIVVLGDSFTLGYGVDDSQTYSAHLQHLAPEVNIINMGQGGYSAGQCVMWYERDGRRFNPHCLVFAIIVDDIWRMGSTLTANGYAMPEFHLKEGEVKITGMPLPEKIDTGDRLFDARRKARFISQGSSLMRTFLAAKPEPKVDQEVLYKMLESLIDRLNHPHVVLVLLPEWRDLTDPNHRNLYGEISRRLQQFSNERQMLFLDLMPAFRQVGPRAAQDFFLEEHWRHYSEAGNEFVARQLHESLSQLPNNPLQPQ